MHHRAGWLDPLFVWLSRLGTFGLVWLALALLLALLWRRPALLALVLGADAVADLAAFGLKEAVGRPRPSVRFPEPRPLVHVPHDGSFPSGHAATSFVCAVLLAFAAPRLAAPLLLLASAIAFSRVYVGVHYPLDVLGGAALGLALALAVLPFARVSPLRAPVGSRGRQENDRSPTAPRSLAAGRRRSRRGRRRG